VNFHASDCDFASQTQQGIRRDPHSGNQSAIASVSENLEPLFEFLQGLGLSEIDTDREFDPGRELTL